MWEYLRTTGPELYHHGVKGQRWGVRRTPAQLGQKSTSNYVYREGDVVVNKGTKFQRIATASNTGFTKGVYTSYKNADKDLYKGVLGRMRVEHLLKENGEVKLNELTMTAKKDVRLPSREVRLEQFKKLYEDDPKSVMNLINEHETARYGHKEKEKFNPESSKQLNKAYEKFNDALSLGPDSPNGKAIRKYYSNLQKLGYDAIPDENDIRLSTFKAQAPIIMFNTNKSIGDISVRELSASEVFSAYQRAMPKKVARGFTRPGNVGKEKLTPEIVKDSEQYARRLEKDKFELNKNYTLQDLANDWGNNRLMAFQISRVSAKMDEGKSHDEAVKEIIAVGNVAADYILDKFNL